MLEIEHLVERTRILVWEQRVALNLVISYCRELIMMRKSGIWRSIKPPNLTVIGGAGTGKSLLINVISLWVQKLLSCPGDDITSPYIIRAAPTGMAASNIESQTLHTAFKLTFGNEYKSLTDKARD